MNKEDKFLFKSVSNITGLSVNNLFLYKIAFQYPTKEGTSLSNERLEFLGDAVLSLVVADFLFKKFPNKQEGFLTDIRSRIVSRNTLNIIAQKIGIPKLLRVSEDKNNKYVTDVFGSGLEALIGAVFLDNGFEKSYSFIRKIISTYLDLEYLIATDINFKSILLEWASKNGKKIFFNFVEKFESEGKFFFKTEVKVGEKIIAKGDGVTKKNSEQNAAKLALEIIQFQKNDTES